MNIPDLIGWGGNLGFFLGAIYIAKKDIKAFFWQIWGNAFYAVQSLILGIPSLFILSIVLIIVNIVGWKNWLTPKSPNGNEIYQQKAFERLEHETRYGI